MARTDSPHRWYLFDYGNVISTAPTPQDWDLLAEAVGVDRLQEPASAYWRHRGAYDAGSLTSDEYWSLVRGRRIEPARSAWLDVLDANQWSHLNLETLDVLEDLDARGERLALLSNMPAAMAVQFAGAPWTRLFRHSFFSSSLRLVKPAPAIFDRVLAELQAAPGQVTFVDDAPANIAAAKGMGIHGLLFEPSSDLSRLLAEGRPVSPAFRE
ncbi:HAD family hydrolase [Arthrobacter antioxidans]|uniref:HAD family hydrolase n=1 Tax=Arthrobacter antioxidans TaxID=2895818 RepID=UPI0020001B0D|nr:HAD family phosphatase [Arthrobacter antioxidans]